MRERLIALRVRLAISLARSFTGRGESLEDLTQVGALGLIKAIDRFEPGIGNQFSTCASHIIKGEIRRHLRDRCQPLKVSRREQELHATAGRAALRMAREAGRAPSLWEVAEHLGVTEEALVYLRFDLELSQAVIAEELNVSQKQVS